MNWFMAHLVGDYLLQNDWMANGKKNSTWICLIHVLFYCVPFVLFGIPPLAVALIGLEHFAQDRTGFVRWYMGAKGQDAFATHLGPWSIIVVDNVLHLLFVYGVMEWLA